MEPIEKNPILREAYDNNRVLDAAGNVYEAMPHCIKESEGRILHSLTKQFDTPRTIETGLAHGISTVFFLQAIAEQGGGHHISIDPYQKGYWNYVGLETVRRSGFERYHTYYEERSQIQLPQLEAAELNVDVAFVDGNHRFEFAFVDFYYMDRLLRPGGYMVLHDFLLGGIAKTISLIVRLHGDCYAFHEPLIKPVRGFRRGVRALQALRRAPLEPAQAVTLSGWDIPNMVVFQKYRHRTESEWGDTWSHYRSF